jgi:hypothetical protein
MSGRRTREKKQQSKSRDIYKVYIRYSRIRDYPVPHRERPCNATNTATKIENT